MEASNNETLIQSFSEITSATRDEALFFLESHNWDLDAAVSTFFDSSAAEPPIISPSPDLSDSSLRSRSQSPPRSPYQLRSRQDKDKQKPLPGSSSFYKERKKAGGIRTLADLNRSADDDDDSGSDSEDPREYYTGGKKSGMLVQDPTRGRDVDSIFDQARQAGVAPGDSVARSSASRSFTGTGRLLSGETVSAAPVQDQQPEPLTHTIYFWRNGFSADDGPCWDYVPHI